MASRKRKPVASVKQLHPAEQYMEDVLSGKVVASRWVKLAVQRQKRDIERAERNDPEFPYRFDRAKAQHAIDFYQFTRHSKGEWARQVIKPEPWQQFIDWCVYGWVHKITGYRRFRLVYEEAARKQGKTTRQSKAAIYHLLADKEDGAEVAVAATKLKQAMLCFDPARFMVMMSPSLNKKLKVNKYNISHHESQSKFEPLGQDSESLDGMNISFAIVDEFHAHKNREIFDLIETATGSRRQPLIWLITTAGKRRSGVCWDMRQYVINILKQSIADETVFGIIFCLDEEDDPFDQANWIKANPNLGVSKKLSSLQEVVAKSRNSPRELSKFLRLHLGIWTGEADGLITERTWALNAEAPDMDYHRKNRTPGWLAFDIASVKDLAAVVGVFPDKRTKKIDLYPLFWTPEQQVDNIDLENRDLVKGWVKSGFIQTTPGSSIKQKYILQAILQLCKEFAIKEILGDRWNADMLIQSLMDRGHNVTVFPQNIACYTAPTKKFEALALDGKFRTGGHPVLAHHVLNLRVVTDNNDNVMPAKKKSAGKIDGAVSTIMGIGGWMSRNVMKRAGSKDHRHNCGFKLEVI